MNSFIASTNVPVAVFQDSDHIYYADTCEPLKAAAQRGEVLLEALGRGSYPGRRLPARALTEVRSVGCWDASSNQSWGLDWHRNEGIELAYIARGKVGFAVDGQEYPLRRGHLMITRPWQLHRVGDPHVAACRLHWLILDVGVRRPHQAWKWPAWMIWSPKNLRQLTTLLQHNEQPVWRANAEIEQCFEKLAHLITIGDGSETQESRLKLHINELFVTLLELLQHTQIPLDKTLTSSRRSVEMFLAALPRQLEHPWDLAAMAKECGLGHSRFSHYCRQITDMSPIEYLTHCRIQTAAQLLKAQPELSITEVAYACGFESSQYFATVFRNYTSCSPNSFRKGLCRNTKEP